MSDIAREMGVSRPTLYKQVGSVEEASRWSRARQLYLILDELQALLARGEPQRFIEMAVQLVTFARTIPSPSGCSATNPTGRQLITSGQLARYSGRVVDLVAPCVEWRWTPGRARERSSPDRGARRTGVRVADAVADHQRPRVLVRYVLGTVLDAARGAPPRKPADDVDPASPGDVSGPSRRAHRRARVDVVYPPIERSGSPRCVEPRRSLRSSRLDPRARCQRSHRGADGAGEAVAEAIVDAFERLGPTFVKLGQLFASSPGLFPATLATACRRTLDRVTPISVDYVRNVIAPDLGLDPDKAFATFDPVPLSAASVAQVHAFTLQTVKRRSSRCSAGARRAAEHRPADPVPLARLAARHRHLRMANPVAVITDLHQVTNQELNFALEADRQTRFRANLHAFGDNLEVTSPEVYWELCGHGSSACSGSTARPSTISPATPERATPAARSGESVVRGRVRPRALPRRPPRRKPVDPRRRPYRVLRLRDHGRAHRQMAGPCATCSARSWSTTTSAASPRRCNAWGSSHRGRLADGVGGGWRRSSSRCSTPPSIRCLSEKSSRWPSAPCRSSADRSTRAGAGRQADPLCRALHPPSGARLAARGDHYLITNLEAAESD